MKKWSVFVYICADDPDAGLFGAALANVSEMRKVGSSDKVGLVAQVDLPAVPTKRYVFPPNTGTSYPETVQVTELDRNINSADARNIVEFFKWANEQAPAEKIFLILWGHGFGIDDFDPFLAATTDSATTAETLGRDSFVFSFPDFHTPFPLISAAIRDATAMPGGLPDAARGTSLQNNQIAAAVAECKKMLIADQQQLALLGFDACDMSLLEVWFEMQGTAPIGIGSQFGIPFKGWPYTRMLKYLLENPESAPADLAKRVVEEFADFNNSKRDKPVVTLSACNLDLTKELAEAIQPLAKALTQASVSAESRAKIFDARNDSPIFDEDGFIDVETFCRLLQVNFPDTEIATYCEVVCQAVQKYVLAHRYAPRDTRKKISLSTGVSLWFPPWIQYPDIEIQEKEQSEVYFHKRYSKTKFAELTGWDIFLKAILVNTRFESDNAMQQEEETMPDSEDDQSGSGEMGRRTRDLGRLPQSMGKQTGGFGKQTQTSGRQTPTSGRQTPTAGRNGVEPGGRVFLNGSSGEAGVVVRATVESFGPVGETELNVTVKWPAGCNCSPAVEVAQKSPPKGVCENVD